MINQYSLHLQVSATLRRCLSWNTWTKTTWRRTSKRTWTRRRRRTPCRTRCPTVTPCITRVLGVWTDSVPFPNRSPMGPSPNVRSILSNVLWIAQSSHTHISTLLYYYSIVRPYVHISSLLQSICMLCSHDGINWSNLDSKFTQGNSWSWIGSVSLLE